MQLGLTRFRVTQFHVSASAAPSLVSEFTLVKQPPTQPKVLPTRNRTVTNLYLSVIGMSIISALLEDPKRISVPSEASAKIRFQLLRSAYADLSCLAFGKRLLAAFGISHSMYGTVDQRHLWHLLALPLTMRLLIYKKSQSLTKFPCASCNPMSACL